MKTTSLFLCFLALAFTVRAQESTANLSLQPDYSQTVFFKFSTGESSSYAVDSWDIAFMRTSDFEFAERINTGRGIEVYEATDDPVQYQSLDPADDSNWTRLYNSDTTWEVGAFDQGSATYGWGEYNAATHHVGGTVVYVLVYPDGSLKKFMIEDFWGGYTFKYASWDATSSSWVDSQEVSLPNSENAGKLFNYYSLESHQSVTASPDMADWDIVFRKYMTSIQGTSYPVLGVLHNPTVTVAENANPNPTDEGLLDFSDNINAVGHDWKVFDGSGYAMVPNKNYFLKQEDGSVYKFYFTTYEGSSTGNFTLNYENITEQLDLVHVDQDNKLRIYPNPTTGKMVNVLYDRASKVPVSIAVYTLNGKKVKQFVLRGEGFGNRQLDLTGLSSGIYFLQFTSDRFLATRRLVLD